MRATVPKLADLHGGCKAWHICRHTFGSRLAQGNANLRKIQTWMGHADIHMTEVYTHLAEGYDADIEKTG